MIKDLRKHQEEEFIFLAEQEILDAARSNVMPFIAHTKPDYEFNWHNEVMFSYLDAWVEKRIKRLMIFMPPRHGKSEAVSRRLPAYILGRFPNARIIGTAYADSLASANNRDVQRIIDSNEYKELFPGTTLSGSNVRTVAQGSWLRNSNEFEVVGHRGGYLSAGIGGGITGRGADYFIIDDPIKNDKEADSVTFREGIKDWYGSTAYTRLEKDACMLVTMTRWHEDDLAGWLLQQAKNEPDADQWTVLSLPAVLEDEATKHWSDPRREGESLWPWKYNEQRLKAMRSTIGKRYWDALFQQNPTALEGGIVKASWIQYYRERPPRFNKIIQSWDLNFKEAQSSDFVVGQVWGLWQNKRYLLDQFRGRVGFTETKAEILKMRRKWPEATRILIEEKANGAAIIETLKRDGITGIIAVNPKESKAARLSAVSVQYEAGDVIYPHPLIAPWIDVNVDELVKFPNARNDDTVDCSTQALNDLSGGVSVLDKMTRM